MESMSKCQVCFTCSSPPELHKRMITCRKCKAAAHLYCYLPSCQSQQFTCDSCQNGYEGVCSICQNPGLLKKADKLYGHPVCLLSNHSFLVNQFSNLSFLRTDALKPGKHTKCLQCKKVNGFVITCGLACSRACHIYCAFKSYISTQGKGWRVMQHICANSTNFQDLFSFIANKALTIQHKFLKKRLTVGKPSKKSHPIILYCEEHSNHVVDCRCMKLDEKNQWIYCDGCCRWQHLQCVSDKIEAEKAVKEEGELYFCGQCINWRKAIQQTPLVIPEELPKFHLFDFVFIQASFEAKNYQISHTLLDFALKLPILPGKKYIEVEYRNEIAKRIRSKIDLPNLRKQLEGVEDGDEQNRLSKFAKICAKEKERLFFVWWLCEGEMLFATPNKQSQFMQKFEDESNFDANILRQIIELLITYNKRFNNGQELKMLKSKLQVCNHHDQTTKSLISRGNISKEDSDQRSASKMKAQKTLAFLTEQLKLLLEKLRNSRCKEATFNVLGEIHMLINKPQVVPYYESLPKIPLVKASILFKSRDKALRYIAVISYLQYARSQWKRIDKPNKCQNMEKFNKVRNIFLAEIDRYFSDNILEEKDNELRAELLKEWRKNEMEMTIPSRQQSLEQPQDFVPDINFESYDGLSLKKVSEILLKYTERHINLYEKIQANTYIKQLSILQNFLKMMQNIPFTVSSLNKAQELLRHLWSGEYTQHIPIVLNQFVKLYELTQLFLSELCINQDEETCLFVQWNRYESQDDDCEKYIQYFKDIDDIKLHYFKQMIGTCLKKQMRTIVDKMESRSVCFKNEMEYKTIRRWWTVLGMNSQKMGSIFHRDYLFQSCFNLHKIQFDNLQSIKQIENRLTEHLQFCKAQSLQFRVHQIKVLLTWIDLQKAVLQRVPAYLLLSSSQAQCYDHQIASKPDYYVLRQILSMMRQLKFPSCQFFDRFVKVVESGEMYQLMINKVLDHCNWGYEISATIDWDSKLSIEQFKSIRENIKDCMFYFQAELLELDIIFRKFDQAERQAQMLRIESQTRSERSYLHEKARRLIISFGCFPIVSQHTKFVWSIFQSPKILGLPENLELYISQLAQSTRLHSWQELENLRSVIDDKIQSRYLKQDICNKLDLLITPNKEFFSKCSSLLAKYNEKILLRQEELSMVGELMEEYGKFQFQDQEIAILHFKYLHYQSILSQMKWRQMHVISDRNKLKFILYSLATLHESFCTPEVIKYKEYVEGIERQIIYRQMISERKTSNIAPKETSKSPCKKVDISPKTSDFSSLQSNAEMKKEKKINQRTSRGCYPSPNNRRNVN